MEYAVEYACTNESYDEAFGGSIVWWCTCKLAVQCNRNHICSELSQHVMLYYVLRFAGIQPPQQNNINHPK